mgnify:CR=1 FL=1
MRKTLTQRALSLLTTFLMVFIMPLSTYDLSTNAEDTGYTISGYNKSRIVTDPDGNKVSGYAYCLDAKEDTPSGQTYTRYRLSEMPNYTKDVAGERIYTEAAKSRLIKLLMEEKNVKKLLKAIDKDAVREALLAEGYITESQVNSWNSSWTEMINASCVQRYVWAFTHDASYWPEFVLDDNINDHADNYRTVEKNKYKYISPDPMNDPLSAWTILYKPVIDYIDNEVPDYYALGYDAWVYLTDDSGHQNMLGTLIPSFTVSKTDVTDPDNVTELKGVTLWITSEDGKDLSDVVLKRGRTTVTYEMPDDDIIEFETGDAPTVVQFLPQGTYTLSEEDAPAGYTRSEPITFNISSSGAMTSSDIDVVDHTLLMEDKKTDVTVNKVDTLTEKLIGTAEFELVNSGDGKKVPSSTGNTWKVTSEGLRILGELDPGIYTLFEKTAPAGYIINNSDGIRFEIAKDGKVTVYYGTNEVTTNIIDFFNAPDKLLISKVAAGSDKELSGAKLTLKAVTQGVTFENTYAKRAGSELALDKSTDLTQVSFVSGSSETEIYAIPAGDYVLIEETAPDGYKVTSQIEFSIGTDGNVVTRSATATNAQGETVLLVDDELTSVKVSKVDVADSKELEGALIQILNADGSVAEDINGNKAEWTSTKEAHEVKGLKTGVEYTLHEVTAPDGYAVSADTQFSIDKNGNIITRGSTAANAQGETVLLVEDKLTSVKVSKVDAANDEEIEGAFIQILDSEGNVVEINGQKIEWTSTTEAHEVKGLKTGVEYRLHEETAPDGYTVASDTVFTIGSNGEIITRGTTTTDRNGNTVILIKDTMTSVKVSKVDVADGKEVEGALIQILDGQGNVVEINGEKVQWTSTTEAHEVKGLNINTEYTLHEVTAPDGYAVAADTIFTIDDNGDVHSRGTTAVNAQGETVLLVEDELTSVKVSKVDVADGKEVEGALIQILDAQGNVVEIGGEKVQWTSATEAHEVKGLKTGVDYKLHEETAPEGYTVAADTDFRIDSNGDIITRGTTTTDTDGNTVLLVQDSKTSVKISKTDVADGKEIEGAFIQILDSEGNVVEIGGQKIEWTSATEAHEVKGLKTGTEYTLHEETAPDGYTVTADTVFSIDTNGDIITRGTTTTDEDGNTVLLVQDEKTSVKISKTDVAEGKEIEGAFIKILDSEGNVVEIDGQKIEWTSATEAHEVKGLKTGTEYTLHEETAPDGYTLTADTKFTIDENGNVTSTATTTDEGVMLVEDSAVKISVNKTDLTGTKEVKNAVLTITNAQLTQEQWEKIAEANKDSVKLTDNGDGITWVSGDKAVEIAYLPNGEYTLTETKGDSDIVDDNGNKYDVLGSSVTFKIDNGSVNVISSDDAGDSFDGSAKAGYSVLDDTVLTICDAVKKADDDTKGDATPSDETSSGDNTSDDNTNSENTTDQDTESNSEDTSSDTNKNGDETGKDRDTTGGSDSSSRTGSGSGDRDGKTDSGKSSDDDGKTSSDSNSSGKTSSDSTDTNTNTNTNTNTTTTTTSTTTTDNPVTGRALVANVSKFAAAAGLLLLTAKRRKKDDGEN